MDKENGADELCHRNHQGGVKKRGMAGGVISEPPPIGRIFDPEVSALLHKNGNQQHYVFDYIPGILELCPIHRVIPHLRDAVGIAAVHESWPLGRLSFNPLKPQNRKWPTGLLVAENYKQSRTSQPFRCNIDWPRTYSMSAVIANIQVEDNKPASPKEGRVTVRPVVSTTPYYKGKGLSGELQALLD
jgi:hypothetical protein